MTLDDPVGDPTTEQERHRKGPTDPTGAVSSGLMPGPLRGRDREEIEEARKDPTKGSQDVD